MYLLILVMAVLGWAATNYRGWPVKLFGVIPLPALAAKGDRWAHTAGDIHTFLVNVLLALVAVHVRRRCITISSPATECSSACCRSGISARKKPPSLPPAAREATLRP